MIPQVASASVILAGWHNFEPSAADETADIAVTGFSGSSLDKNSGLNPDHASWTYAGSKDGTYGGRDPGLEKPGAFPPFLPDTGAEPPFEGGDSNPVVLNRGGSNAEYDGSVVIKKASINDTPATANTPVFTISNRSGSTYVLEALVFDAAWVASTDAAAKLEFSLNGGSWYSFNDLPLPVHQVGGLGYYPGASIFPSSSFPTADSFKPGIRSHDTNGYSTDTVGSGYSADFTDFDYLLGLVLGDQQDISFRFTLTGDTEMRLDNIAVTGFTAIPEPGSLLALGCLVGSGAFLRTRRRRG